MPFEFRSQTPRMEIRAGGEGVERPAPCGVRANQRSGASNGSEWMLVVEALDQPRQPLEERGARVVLLPGSQSADARPAELVTRARGSRGSIMQTIDDLAEAVEELERQRGPVLEIGRRAHRGHERRNASDHLAELACGDLAGYLLGHGSRFREPRRVDAGHALAWIVWRRGPSKSRFPARALLCVQRPVCSCAAARSAQLRDRAPRSFSRSKTHHDQPISEPVSASIAEAPAI
jgi:hypothetical protein